MRVTFSPPESCTAGKDVTGHLSALSQGCSIVPDVSSTSRDYRVPIFYNSIEDGQVARGVLESFSSFSFFLHDFPSSRLADMADCRDAENRGGKRRGNVAVAAAEVAETQ